MPHLFRLRPLTQIIVLVASCTGAFALGAHLAEDKTPRSSADWVRLARDSDLMPCYSNDAIVRVGAMVIEANYAKSAAERTELARAGRIIPHGPHEGTVIPEGCFAVEDGLFGFATAMWMRPSDLRGGSAADLPYWNPQPE